MKNEATLFVYRNNAALFVQGESTILDWDGITFETLDEYNDWIKESLMPAQDCENYNEIKLQLEIETDYLRPYAQ